MAVSRGDEQTEIPAVATLLGMVQGCLLTQALGTAADLGVADALNAGPLSLAELARRVGADPAVLTRLLRPLVAEGIFAVGPDGQYSLTSLGRPLRSDDAASVRNIARVFATPTLWRLWSRLTDAVVTGKLTAPRELGMPFFDYLVENRSVGTLFDNSMTGFSDMALEPLLASYDFTGYDVIVDVAGGRGRFLTEILARTPDARGVLFDLPEVVNPVRAELARLGRSDRCRIETGSFLDAVPPGGDLYILKHIVHDWPEDISRTLLRNVHRAMSGNAVLLVIETVVPEDDQPHPGKLMDLGLLLMSGGRERSESEYRKLLSECGFQLKRRIPTGGYDDILEVHPV